MHCARALGSHELHNKLRLERASPKCPATMKFSRTFDGISMAYGGPGAGGDPGAAKEPNGGCNRTVRSPTPGTMRLWRCVSRKKCVSSVCTSVQTHLYTQRGIHSDVQPQLSNPRCRSRAEMPPKCAPSENGNFFCASGRARLLKKSVLAS